MNQLQQSSDLLDWILENHISRIANEVVENIDIKILVKNLLTKLVRKAQIKKYK